MQLEVYMQVENLKYMVIAVIARVHFALRNNILLITVYTASKCCIFSSIKINVRIVNFYYIYYRLPFLFIEFVEGI